MKFQNPCDSQYPNGESFADLVMPAFLNVGETGQHQQQQQKHAVLTREEFDAIEHDCRSLFQTNDRLKSANFYRHLLNYDPPEGLRLATSEMMIQGYDNGGDLLRMANNIIQLERARQHVIMGQSSLEEDPLRENNSNYYSSSNSNSDNNHNKELQILTMSLDEFVARPASSALEFFDFIMDDNNNDMIRQRKEEVALKYENHFYEKVKAGVKHITHGRLGNEDGEELIEYLRSDGVFGPPLHKIEVLVETALATMFISHFSY